MNAPRHRSKSLRRRLFTSHVVVMVVALAVFATVMSLVIMSGEARTVGVGKRGGGPSPLLLALFAAAASAGFVSWRMTRRLAYPLERIGAATRELAAGRYGTRVPGADTTELNAVAANVNQLAYELGTTEQRRLRLIGDVAHELRNPLSTIEGTMEALLDGVVAADEDTFARVGREAARLRRLADDLSSLSAAGESSIGEVENVDLAEVLVDVVAQLQPQAAAKDLVVCYRPVRIPAVSGDRDRLTQVMMNVIGNAVQYTDSGHVTVALSATKTSVAVNVADTGRGLAAEDQTRIFERFHRVDEQFTDGTGVGLAIAKLIVEAHNGKIWATSPGLGDGTTVYIEVPKAVPDPGAN